MSSLDRYLLKESFLPAGIGIFFLLFILLGNRFLKLFPLLVEARIPMGEVLITLSYLIPSFLLFALPPALFLGWVVGLSRLGSDGELVGAMGLGISPGKFLRSAVFVSLFAGLLTLLISQWGYAQGRALFSQRIKDLARRYALSALAPGVVLNLPRETFLAMARPSSGGRAILYFASPDLGVVGGNISYAESLTSVLHIEQGFLYSWDGTAPVFLEFQEGMVRVELPLEEFSFGEVDTLLYLYRHREEPTKAYGFYRYLSFAASFLYAPWAAYLIASRRLRSGRGNALLRTVVVLLLFYTLMNLGHRLVQKELLSPALGAFLPHILVIPVGVALYFKWHRPGPP